MGDHWSRPAPAPLAPPLSPVHGGRFRTAPASASRGPRPTAPGPAWAGMRAPGVTSARSRALRRRRDILTALVVAAGATLVLGALPFLRMLWAAHLAFDVLLVAYVALLIRQRNMAAERDMKLRFLPSATALEPAMVRAEPALLRRTAAN